MAIRLELGLDDLAATRFAVSPLSETVTAVLLLADPDRATINRPWIDWAAGRLAETSLAMPRLWPLVNNGFDFYPEFLAPAPATPRPSLARQLTQLRTTSPGAVRASLERVFGGPPWPPSASALHGDPVGELGLIAAELESFHRRLVAPHWERIQAVLEADIAHWTAQLAHGGARALLGDLHPDLTWSAGVLSLDDDRAEVTHVALGPDGVVLVPSVFNWPLLSPAKATSSQTTLIYPARGVATVWEPLADRRAGRLAPVADIIGVTRAGLLDTLRSPATTSSLARHAAVTPGAISQHLGALHRAGLLTRWRNGRAVLYQTSDLGLALLEAGAPR